MRANGEDCQDKAAAVDEPLELRQGMDTGGLLRHLLHANGAQEAMTRSEHIAWAQQRALEYVERGNLRDAITSMISDLSKHPDLRHHLGIVLAPFARQTEQDVRHWIEGFR